MTKLILPNTTEIINPSRRGFVKGAAFTLAGLFAAPAIVKATNLMDINSKQNRLRWALADRYEYEEQREFAAMVGKPFKPESVYWIESGLNAKDNWNDQLISDWKAYNKDSVYELKRVGEITRLRSEDGKRDIFNNFIYSRRNGDPTMLIRKPKKADIII